MLTPGIIKAIVFTLYILFSTGLARGQKWSSLESITYFPPEIYRNLNNKVDSMGYIRKSILLANFKEQKLFNAIDSSSVFRFTWLRSFDLPMIFSLVKVNNKITLQIKTGNKIGMIDKSYYDFDKLKKKDNERFQKYMKGELDSTSVRDIFVKKGFFVKDTVLFRYSTETKDISNAEYNNFIYLLKNSDFWTTSLTIGSFAYHDGAVWLVEGYTKENGYHVVDRHSPRADGKDKGIREIGEYLIHLYGNVEKMKIY